MNSLVEFFDKLLTNFTWSRLTLTVVLLFLVIGALFGYEAYTQHFALGRLSEQVKIFDQLVATSGKINLTEKEQLINESYKKLMSAFNSQVDYKQFVYIKIDNENKGRDDAASESHKELAAVSKYSYPEWFTRSIYILLPWFIVSLLILLFSRTGDKAKAMAGAMLIGVIFLVIGMILPSFKEYPWVMKWLYPWGTMLALISFIVILDYRKRS